MTIRLQLIKGYFYPVDCNSQQTLLQLFELERFPEHRFDIIAPKCVSEGHCITAADYNPDTFVYNAPESEKIGGMPKPQKNPCQGCTVSMVCDRDICSRGWRQLARK